MLCFSVVDSVTFIQSFDSAGYWKGHLVNFKLILSNGKEFYDQYKIFVMVCKSEVSIFFFYWAPVAGAPGSTAAMKAYFMSPALDVPAFPARSPTPTTRETSSKERGNCG
jgi:hypothetical protein